MLATMATRSRTMAAANSRKECVGVYEIDRTATKGDEKNLANDDLANLNMARTGAAWDRNTVFWAVNAMIRIASYGEKKKKRTTFGLAKRWKEKRGSR